MDVFISNYKSIMLFWLLFEWNVNVSTPHPATEISLTHITRRDKRSLSPRTFKHSELPRKTMYLLLNFKSKLGTYEHDLLAYERDARGCKFAPGCKFATGCKFAPGANCAHEHGLRLTCANIITQNMVIAYLLTGYNGTNME